MDNFQNEYNDRFKTITYVREEDRTAFYKKTYAHVALAVLGFILVEAMFLNIPGIRNFALSLTKGWLWLAMLGGFMLVTSYAEKMALGTADKGKQYLALAIYVIAEAFIFLPLIYIAIAMAGGQLTLIYQAAIVTLSLFTGLSAAVLLTKKDFSFLKTALTIGFFVAIGLIVAGIAFGFNLGLWFSVAMVVLAAGSILYSTSNLVHKYNTEQYVAAALSLFASLMLLFWYILRIFMRD